TRAMPARARARRGALARRAAGRRSRWLLPRRVRWSPRPSDRRRAVPRARRCAAWTTAAARPAKAAEHSAKAAEPRAPMPAAGADAGGGCDGGGGALGRNTLGLGAGRDEFGGGGYGLRRFSGGNTSANDSSSASAKRSALG